MCLNKGKFKINEQFGNILYDVQRLLALLGSKFDSYAVTWNGMTLSYVFMLPLHHPYMCARILHNSFHTPFLKWNSIWEGFEIVSDARSGKVDSRRLKEWQSYSEVLQLSFSLKHRPFFVLLDFFILI